MKDAFENVEKVPENELINIICNNKQKHNYSQLKTYIEHFTEYMDYKTG
jgi:hypothetical protein